MVQLLVDSILVAHIKSVTTTLNRWQGFHGKVILRNLIANNIDDVF